MKTKIALVLSGGGARGIAHIGAIEELERQGYEISSIAGTSMGALIGGVYALGKLEEYKEWMFKLDRRRVFKLVDFTLSKQGLVKGEKVLNAMKEFIPDTNIENLPLPYVAVAVDLLKREEVVFNSGSVFEAIRASISIPTVLKPVESGEKLLVDGGVLNNVPIDHVKRSPGDILVAVYVNADVPKLDLGTSVAENEKKDKAYQKKIREFQSHLKKITPLGGDEKMGYFDLINKTISTMTHHNSQIKLDQFSPDIMVNVSRKSSGTYDFYKAEELVEIGRLATMDSIREFRKISLPSS